MKKMYPAVVNSPKTELTDLITESQMDITVADIEVLLTGEGIATIGNGGAAETILYTSVDGNKLIGCVRGFQGVARAWTAGTRIARNFAAADWDAARENILELADRLDTPERTAITLQPGIHVVQADQDAAFKLAGLQGRTVLNYQSQIGIFGVLNPYVIRWTDADQSNIAAMLALQTELHANPDTGANPDSVFEGDGQYFKLAKWRKVVLDGKYDYAILNNYVGYKRVLVTVSLPPKSGASYATKYTGTQLVDNDTAVAADRYDINSAGIILSISNTDSGWGDSYTPSADEIKAYFMGWVMTTQESWSTAPVPYNGTGTKGWVRRWLNVSQGNPSTVGSIGTWVDNSATPTVPTTMSTGFTPYQLLYQLATPTVEPITSEGQLTFIEGDNQIEVGTGIVLREGTKPALSTQWSSYEINSLNAGGGVASNPLKYKAKKVMTIYKNGRSDKWERSTDANSYGLERAYQTVSLFDSSASYSVTYLMLDKYPAADFTGTYADNEKALLLDAVKSIQEHTTRISVLESKKAEKDAPAWITPTLLNGWSQLTPAYATAQYNKDSMGIVRIRGMIKGGLLGTGTKLFNLPEGYRPKGRIIFNCATFDTSPVVTTVEVTSDGSVFLGYIASAGWLNLEGISFNVNL